MTSEQAIIPVRFAGLCNGPSGMQRLIASITSSSMSTETCEFRSAMQDSVSYGIDLRYIG